jgi:acyl-CoA reductase-like NAD-dependent aldehyde dehydrogenase
MEPRSLNLDEEPNPSRFAELTDQQLETALETAAACFAIWRNASAEQRAAVVTRAATLMRMKFGEGAYINDSNVRQRTDIGA